MDSNNMKFDVSSYTLFNEDSFISYFNNHKYHYTNDFEYIYEMLYKNGAHFLSKYINEVIQYAYENFSCLIFNDSNIKQIQDMFYGMEDNYIYLYIDYIAIYDFRIEKFVENRKPSDEEQEMINKIFLKYDKNIKNEFGVILSIGIIPKNLPIAIYNNKEI